MSWAAAYDGGRIRGYVVDPTGASLPAHIRLVTRDPKSPWIKGDTNWSGEFLIEDVPPGSYRVEAWSAGFRANHVSDVLVSARQTVDVGTIELNLIGCDDPGVICDDFGLSPKPDPHPIIDRVGLTLSLGAGADLDRGRLAEVGSKKADLWLNGRDGELYLSPGDGARFSTLNPATAGCTDVHYDKDPVRIDGLGPGYDLCVRTKIGRFAHVLITSEVPANTVEVKIWLVTRK
jgi:hypothetical protein